MRFPYLLIALWFVASLLLYRWMHKQQQAWEMSLETRLRLAVDAAQVGIWMRDFQSNALQWSAEFKQLLGYAPDELKESHEDWMERLHPDDREPSLRRLQRIRDAPPGRYDAEMRLRHRDGTYRTILSRALLIREAGGTATQLLGAGVDITERKQAWRVQAQLAAIVESTTDAIVGRAPDDTIITWNAAAERLFGWTANEALGQPFRSLLPIGPTPRKRQRFDQVLRGEAFATIEDMRRHKDGSIISVDTTMSAVKDSKGEVIFVACIMRDVSARKQAEQAQARLAAIVENSNVAILSRALDGTILSWNAGAEKSLGYSAAEAVGKSILITLPPGRRPNLEKNSATVIESRVVSVESDRRTKDGRLIVVLANHAAIRDAAGRVLGVSVILQDITQRMQYSACSTSTNHFAAAGAHRSFSIKSTKPAW